MQQLFFRSEIKLMMIFLIAAFALPFFSAAHYIVGLANNAIDGRSSNDLDVVLWNPVNGISDNLTDTIGVNGNSGTPNFYLIDCEGLNTPCDIGDTINVKVSSSPFSEAVSVVVTGAGYDVEPNITLNSLPYFTSLIVDDSFTPPTFAANEIDLLANSTQQVFCEAVVNEFDGSSLQNISGEFFKTGDSFFGDSDDNNLHYTNNSCFLNESYGNETESQVVCSFWVLYNAHAGEWNCTITAEDNLSVEGGGYDTTNVNELLSIGVQDSADFGFLDLQTVSPEVIINITNFGNVAINLSLSGYGGVEEDNYSMVCSNGNISIGYKKYNLSSSTPGNLSFGEFEDTYLNLTSFPTTRAFNLNYRQNESFNEAINSTYWRIYVPSGVSGTCSGNIVFQAVVGAEE